MNATASPLFQPLCESLTTIARGVDARALRAHLEGRGLPILGGDAEPAELILRAIGEAPDLPRLAADLAPPLAQVIAECMAELKAEGLTPILQLLLHQTLRLAADLPANATLADSLRALAVSLEEAAPDFWYQAPLAPLMARALVYQQTDSQTESLWLRLLESSGEGPWTPERRTVLLSAWRGLLHVPPDEEAARAGRVINIGRVEHGLLALEAGVRSRENGLRLVRQALRVLVETFPRSPQFWADRLGHRADLWPAELREEAVRQWPELEGLAKTVPNEVAEGVGRPVVEPRTPVEHELMAIWREVLGVDQIGIYDNFFELGGDSLQLLEARQRLKEELKRNIPATEFFVFPTVAALAHRLEEEADDPVAAAAPKQSKPRRLRRTSKMRAG
ncbi:MAG TPA: phosphopantetheine-binding protein [Thermoanaerobaculia bacterium]|nr:phosphopantetheine-binding protein [Thermoanaerobaculia bacterium]